jgi:purine-binding chemotaxis protein CheW
MSTRTPEPPEETAGFATQSRPTILIARLDFVRCALPVEAIVEVTRAVAITPLRSGPRAVEGVVDYHGEMIAVIDLRERLGLPPRPPLAADHFIIARARSRLCGFRVDEAVGITDLEPADFVAASAIVVGVRAVAGVGRTAEGLVLLQDLAGMLSQAEEEALAAALISDDARDHSD